MDLEVRSDLSGVKWGPLGLASGVVPSSSGELPLIAVDPNQVWKLASDPRSPLLTSGLLFQIAADVEPRACP
eukprot:10310105-Alexandrium_andersonii.AAC.1